jgi:Cation efflux family
MSPVELPVINASPVVAGRSTVGSLPDEAWVQTARRARLLSWASLAWMTVEGVVGLIAGLDASALSVIVWAASSFVEGLASIIVIWRFTGSRTMSPRSEHLAQRLVAGSFLLLVPFFVYEAIRRLVVGSDTTSSTLGIAVTASAIVLMPLLGYAKLRLGQRLGSRATAGEGIQNLMCAAQAAAALTALVGASAGSSVIDPIAALIVAAIAATESVRLWRGEQDDCCAPVGLSTPRQATTAAPAATAAVRNSWVAPAIGSRTHRSWSPRCRSIRPSQTAHSTPPVRSSSSSRGWAWWRGRSLRQRRRGRGGSR